MNMDSKKDDKNNINGNWRLFNPNHISNYNHNSFHWKRKKLSIKKTKSIVSYGILAHDVFINNDEIVINYCLTQRRDTIIYMEFLRNRISDEKLPNLLPSMTKDEI